MKPVLTWFTGMAALTLVMLTTPVESYTGRGVCCFAVFCFAIGITVSVACVRRRL